MSDTRKSEISPQYVAYLLMQDIMHVEKKDMRFGAAFTQPADRQLILDTYAECLSTVLDPYSRN